MLIFAIKDEQIGNFLKPFCAENEITAKRITQFAVNDVNTNVHAYAQHFALYRMGEFDDEAGRIIQLSNEPRYVVGCMMLRMTQPILDGSGKYKKHDEPSTKEVYDELNKQNPANGKM